MTEEKEIVIRAKNLEKKYKQYKNNKEKMVDMLTPISKGRDFYAVKGVSFEIEKGKVVGIIGVNGSGKSTLLTMVAGLLPETSGEIEVKGSKAILEVNSGLKQNLTGRDNIYLKCLMLGFKMDEIKAMEENIIEFSELQDFIDQPIKGYSKGMSAKLGFAISINLNPDILIIDEALSVGDKTFAQKCLKKIKEIKEHGKTIIIVSHNNSHIRDFCDEVIWMEYGKIKMMGETKEVLPKYKEFVDEFEKMSDKKQAEYRKDKQFNYKKEVKKA